MRLLFFGDMAATGFGTVTMDLGRALLSRGVDVRFVSQNELGDLPEPFLSRTWAGANVKPWVEGEQKVTGLIDGSLWSDGWTADACVILGDVYAVRRFVFATPGGEEAFRATPTFHYVPIEGEGLPPSFDHLWKIVTPIAMSNFGADEIAKVMGYRPPMIYHGVDTTMFRPVSRMNPLRLGAKTIRSKEDAKRHFNWKPEWRVMLRVDSHWPRKDYGSLISALKPVIEDRKDTILAMHCSVTDKFLNDDLRDHLSWYAPHARARAGSTNLHDRGFSLSRPELVALYNAADVYVSSSAEGFGLTIAEAVACGVPAVGLDYSSVPEVIGPAGITVPAERIRNEYAHYWAHVDEGAFGEAVADLLDHPKKRERLGAKGPGHIKANFQWAQAARQIVDLVQAKEAVAA